MRNAPLNKLLKMNNFGVYYKTGEKDLISTSASDEMIADKMHQLGCYDVTGRINAHKNDYLIVPIVMEVKLTQNDP